MLSSTKCDVWRRRSGCWANRPTFCSLLTQWLGANCLWVEYTRCGSLCRATGYLTPTEHTLSGHVQRATALMARLARYVKVMQAQEHDAAFCRHQPPASSGWLCVDASHLVAKPQGQIFSVMAPGFRDFSRIAASDPTMDRHPDTNREQLLIQSPISTQSASVGGHDRQRQRARCTISFGKPVKHASTVAHGACRHTKRTIELNSSACTASHFGHPGAGTRTMAKRSPVWF